MKAFLCVVRFCLNLMTYLELLLQTTRPSLFIHVQDELQYITCTLYMLYITKTLSIFIVCVCISRAIKHWYYRGILAGFCNTETQPYITSFFFMRRSLMTNKNTFHYAIV